MMKLLLPPMQCVILKGIKIINVMHDSQSKHAHKMMMYYIMKIDEVANHLCVSSPVPKKPSFSVHKKKK